MKQTRRGVFETNSSSTHSLSIQRSGNLTPSNLIVDYDNKVHVSFGEFGWEIESYSSQMEKLSYLCTMVVETEARQIESEEEFYKLDGFVAINLAISEYCNCDGIVVEDASFKVEDWGLDHSGYIDYQSCEDYSSLSEYLNDYSTDVINYVFNSGIVLHTNNDNH